MSKLIRMANYLPFPKAYRLTIQSRLIDRSFRRDISSADRDHDSELRERLESDRRFELRLIQEEQSALYSRQLVSKARRLRVPIPPAYDSSGNPGLYWQQGRTEGLWSLTDKGIALLREQIRAELRWRNENRGYWINWISVLAGLIGAITGLLAVVLYHP